jgi:hypothetical protein
VSGAAAVTLRLAEERDAPALARLAALEMTRRPAAPVLVADIDGRLLAAISLVDCAVVADPYRPTAELVELLRARVRQLGAGCTPPRRGGVRAWIARRTPALG